MGPVPGFGFGGRKSICAEAAAVPGQKHGKPLVHGGRRGPGARTWGLARAPRVPYNL